jgi:hypothetical protein
MTESLDLTGAPLDLGGGVRLDAPDLRGRVTLYEAVQDRAAMRNLAAPALDEPLVRAGFRDLVTLELEVEAVGAPGVTGLRGPAGEEAMLLALPDLGEDQGQAVLAVDEAGVASWSFAVGEDGSPEPAAVRGAGGVKRFLVRSHVPAGGGPGTRGLLGRLGRKLVRALVYPITDPLFGRVGRFFAERWEDRHRPYGVRLFTPEGYTRPDPTQMSGADWERMARDRALLYLHGTFSTAHGAFGGLPPEVFTALHQRYGGRVFAFDHYTLSHDPERNVRWLLEQIPPRVALELDVVCHSRGGLVARTLAERLDRLEAIDPGRLTVERVVFVGVPNRGTALTDPDHLVDFLDRLTSVLNLFPTNAAAEILDALLVVVKVLGHGVLGGLDGLAAMNPRGPFVAALNRGGAGTADYFAIAADYEPAGALREFVRQVADAALDRVFDDAPNDLVVPTLGAFDDNGHPRFPIAGDRVLELAPERGVIHTRYFGHPTTGEKLLAWLS